MKNAPVLKVMATICALVLLAGPTCVLALDTTTTAPETKVISSVSVTTTLYNAFNVAYSSLTNSDSTLRTTDGNQVSTTVSHNTQFSKWIDGALKAVGSEGTSTVTNTVGAIMSVANTVLDYAYSAVGALLGAAGTTTSSGSYPDGSGDFTQTTVPTYTILHGVPVVTSSTTTTNVTVDGQPSRTSTETTTYEYQLLGGENCVMKETSVQHTSTPNGSFSDITTIKTYDRNENGLCTGMAQSKTGSRTTYDSAGGKTVGTLSYSSTFDQDSETGWHIVSETETWTDVVSS